MQSEHDNAVNKVLAALRDAQPPKGMNARIAERLHNHAAGARTALRGQDIFTGSDLTGAWWRGAISGATTAALIFAALLGANHLLQRHIGRGQSEGKTDLAMHNAAPSLGPANSTTQNVRLEGRDRPCARPAILRASESAFEPRPKFLQAGPRSQVEAPSHPAPALPLTAQERQLARLARTADPSVLIALNSETEARVEAEDTAKFAKFFAPPPPLPPSPEDHPATSPAANLTANPEAEPPTNAQPAAAVSPNADAGTAATQDAGPSANETNRSKTKEEE